VKKLSYLILLFIFISIPIQLASLYYKNDINPKGVEGVAGIQSRIQDQRSGSVNVFAFVGDHYFNLYGYTSPQALVTFEGMGIFDQTTADDKGYFEFNNRFSPFSSREACLSSKDQFGRLSSPVCLPPFPVSYNVTIGPVIMPPTISLDKKDYFIGDEVILSGQTVPNTDVNLSMFGDAGKKFEARSTKFETNSNFKILILKIISDFALIRPVEAFTFPKITSMSDSKGNFSINLPSSNPEKYRLFAQVNHVKSISPNSVKLNLEILPVWMIVIKFFLFLFSLIRPRLLEILILAEIIYIIYVIKSHIQSKAIVKYQNHLPEIEESHLPMIKNVKS